MAAGTGLLVYEAVLSAFFVANLAVGVASGTAECYALGSSAGGRVGNCEHGDDGAEDDGRGAGAVGSNQGVAFAVVRFHADGRHGEVGAVDGDHGCLREAGFRIVLLDCRVDRDGGDD